jgi:hypothetical protein
MIGAVSYWAGLICPWLHATISGPIPVQGAQFSDEACKHKLRQIKKAEHAKGLSFGNSAILRHKTRRFPSPSHEEFGFIGISML